MKKLLSRIFVVMMILTNAFPLFAFAAETRTPAPVMPYEKVAAKSGDWYAEQFSFETGSNLVTGYLGSYDPPAATPNLKFKITEDTQLKGIYLPYFAQTAEPIVISLVDSKGNIYPDFPTEMMMGAIKEQENAPNDVIIVTVPKLTYAFIPQREFVLPAGEYTMNLSDSNGAVGAFLVKGINQAAYERYKEKLNEWDLRNNPEKTGASETSILGNEGFDKDKSGKFEEETTETPPAKNPMIFALDEAYVIDEIIINTYNGGAGAEPGTIAVYGEDGVARVTQKAYGSSFGDVANGAWTISPGIKFEAGNYYVQMSNPEAMVYDKVGDPLFYIKASPPVEIRYDFTGTYRINLDTYKTSTIMGPVSDSTSSFSLKDFELVVLDKEGVIELIGKYQGMPFSQNATIVEETENMISATFDFAADLSKLPYKAKIGAQGIVTLTKPENGAAQISIDGTGTFERAATAEEGADFNTYTIASKGELQSQDLPPFVMTALGKAGGVGNVPGSDTSAQTAAGILFPPLVGLVVASLQEALNKKEAEKAEKKAKAKAKKKAKSKIHDRNWYKEQNPNASDETIAMIMLADAMGGTDNPDEGDEVSVGDNEGSGGESGGDADGDYEPEGNQEDSEEENVPNDEVASEEKKEPESETVKEPEEAKPEEKKPEEPVPVTPEEPEDMVLQTSANGAQSRYVKDPVTGEWVNPETGGVLDYEEYKAKAAQQFEAQKKIIDADFEKNSNSENLTDKINRDEMEKIKQKEMQNDYIEKKKDKYGIDNVEDINTLLKERAVKEEANFKKWQTIGDINAVGEVGATVVGAVADAGIDGLSTVTPGGSYIKAGYKVAKGVAGTVADKGLKDGRTIIGAIVEGGIKGGADAATDFIKPSNPYGKFIAKAVTTVAGESGGSAAGAAIRGGDEEWAKAGAQGAIDGIFKVGVGAVTDGIVGDAPDVTIPSGALKILPTMKNVIINKPSLQKIGSSLTDEFVVKPVISAPIKTAIGDSMQSKK